MLSQKVPAFKIVVSYSFDQLNSNTHKYFSYVVTSVEIGFDLITRTPPPIKHKQTKLYCWMRRTWNGGLETLLWHANST